MKKYKTSWLKDGIAEVEVDRETENFVLIGKKRESKEGTWGRYFDTWEEAKAWLVRDAETSVEIARDRLARDEKHLAAVQALQKL